MINDNYIHNYYKFRTPCRKDILDKIFPINTRFQRFFTTAAVSLWPAFSTIPSTWGHFLEIILYCWEVETLDKGLKRF